MGGFSHKITPHGGLWPSSDSLNERTIQSWFFCIFMKAAKFTVHVRRGNTNWEKVTLGIILMCYRGLVNRGTGTEQA